MATTHSKFEFSGEMFEQAMEADAWKPMLGPTSKQVEASEQLGDLARNVSSYKATPISEAPDDIAQEQAAQPIFSFPKTARARSTCTQCVCTQSGCDVAPGEAGRLICRTATGLPHHVSGTVSIAADSVAVDAGPMRFRCRIALRVLDQRP